MCLLFFLCRHCSKYPFFCITFISTISFGYIIIINIVSMFKNFPEFFPPLFSIFFLPSFYLYFRTISFFSPAIWYLFRTLQGKRAEKLTHGHYAYTVMQTKTIRLVAMLISRSKTFKPGKLLNDEWLVGEVE